MLVLFIACLSSCAGTQDSVDVSNPEREIHQTEIPAATPQPSLTFTPEPTFTPTVTPIVILDPEPIEIRFNAEDGVELEGLYYPAAENPAPIIVLVHWARGDMTEWEQVALWLQDRDQLVRAPDYNQSWKSSDWFPEYQSDEPMGVFTFTLRGCQDGCSTYSPVQTHK